jgi:glutathione S-transferase
MKLETWLRMAGIPYVAKEIEGPPKSRSGKVPYIERSDGSLLSDSSAIIRTLTSERGVTLDAGLSDDERAIAVLAQRTFEEELYFLVLHDRWVEDAAWAQVSVAYFSHFPWLLQKLVLPLVRRKVIQSAHGQGASRLSAAERADKGKQDIAAVAQLLGDKPFFFGRPSTLDAIAYGFLANVVHAPLESDLRSCARSHANLLAFCERMKQTYWADWKS